MDGWPSSLTADGVGNWWKFTSDRLGAAMGPLERVRSLIKAQSTAKAQPGPHSSTSWSATSRKTCSAEATNCSMLRVRRICSMKNKQTRHCLTSSTAARTNKPTAVCARRWLINSVVFQVAAGPDGLQTSDSQVTSHGLEPLGQRNITSIKWPGRTINWRY